MSVIIGIDPGLKGGLCVLEGSDILFVDRVPLTPISKGKVDYDLEGMANMIRPYLDKKPIVYLERVGARPKQGVTSMFTFGRGYGIWIGICAAFQIPIKYAWPTKWKRKLVVDKKGKEGAIKVAQELFPDVDLKPGRSIKNHDGMADAICIAFYGGLEEWS